MSIPAPVLNYVVDPLERAARTFVQQFAVVLVATGTAGLLVTQNWVVALDSAAFAAVVSILTSVLTFKVPALSVKFDLVLRVVKTFAQSFVGTLTAAQVATASGADWKGALAVAVPVALSALVTGLAAVGLTGTVGASLLPAGVATAIDSDVPEVDVDAEDARVDVDEEYGLDSLNVSNEPEPSPRHAA